VSDSVQMKDNPSITGRPGTRFRVVLVQPEKEGNIGAIARSMRNFGLRDLCIVSPKTSVGDEAYRYATEGKEILKKARIVDALSDALRGIDRVVGTTAIVSTSSRNILRLVIDPSQLASRVAGAKGSVALLFGRESTGLTNRELQECDVIVSIPGSEEYNVLNVATAASIVFYELYKVRQIRPRSLEPSQLSIDRLVAVFDQLADIADAPAHKKRLAHRAFKNVLAKSIISRREVSLIIGVLRKARDRAQAGLSAQSKRR
jgi:tRNA/rRNA methyltransferase